MDSRTNAIADEHIIQGLPPNVVQHVIGHSRASFTLARYPHAPADFED